MMQISGYREFSYWLEKLHSRSFTDNPSSHSLQDGKLRLFSPPQLVAVRWRAKPQELPFLQLKYGGQGGSSEGVLGID